MPDEEIRLPGPTDRTAIVGRTGSGKTVAALWHLSNSDIDERPWVVLNFKNDKLINRINPAERISFDELPDDPGVYILNITPGEINKLSDWFRRVWEQEDIGILIDEGYMIDARDDWFNACLTQGRSKSISMIILSQRPVWLSRFVFSEATFFQVFDLTHDKDMDKVREYVRDDSGAEQLDRPLPPFHSFYYDVGHKELDVFGPVPDQESVLNIINARLFDLEYELEDRPRRRPL